MNILVTGGAGYIGSHIVNLLSQHYNIIIVDNLVYGHKELVQNIPNTILKVGSIDSKILLKFIFQHYKIDAVIHLAAYAYVDESVSNPIKYYSNNVEGTLNLLQCMVDANVKNIIFSSTCATYGNPLFLPLTEDHPQIPINPYGKTKLIVEMMLKDFHKAYGLNFVGLRYFNAAGANPQGKMGEDHNPESHLIPNILLSALGKKESVTILGTDHPTKDGTCIRDYIHVEDLANAHILALKYLLEGGESDFFNLSNGNGYSVKKVIEIAEKITGKKIKVEFGPKREGDPAELIGNSQKAFEILNWQPKYRNLEKIIQDAWNWHKYRHG